MLREVSLLDKLFIALVTFVRVTFFMLLHVLLEVFEPAVPVGAVRTLVNCDAVSRLMPLSQIQSVEALGTGVATVRLLLHVGLQMITIEVLVEKQLVTLVTDVAVVAGVDPKVACESLLVEEALTADATHQRVFARVRHHVTGQSLLMGEALTALAAFEWVRWMGFHMPLERFLAVEGAIALCTRVRSSFVSRRVSCHVSLQPSQVGEPLLALGTREGIQRDVQARAGVFRALCGVGLRCHRLSGHFVFGLRTRVARSRHTVDICVNITLVFIALFRIDFNG